MLILGVALPTTVTAQTKPNMVVLKGLAAISTLSKTPEGRRALAANFSVTRDIQTGAAGQPLLLTFAEQQQQSLRDAFITEGNGAGLVDGLGTKLEQAYRSQARYIDKTTFTSVSKSIADLIGYTTEITKSDSNAGKFFFANATTDGKTPVSAPAKEIITAVGGKIDAFGIAYDRTAGSVGTNVFGNSRPFETEPYLVAYRGADYLGRPSHSLDWLRGPNQNLVDSPSYPSGHATYGYTEAVLFAILVPERYPQMVARAAEYGNDRIVLGAHYAMDVIGSRATALHAVAHLLANDPDYVGPPRLERAAASAAIAPLKEGIVIRDYMALMNRARADLRDFLRAACGREIASCAADDASRFRNAAADEALYVATQTYGLPIVNADTANAVEDVGRLAPEAGRLLTAAFPSLSLSDADAILTKTEGPGGGFLDDGSEFGVYSRINLYAASRIAATAAVKARSVTNAAPSRGGESSQGR